MCPRKRRDLLALAGATATSLAAGCLSTGHGEFNYSATTDDQTTEKGAVAGSGDATATVDGQFAATTWLPSPAELGYDDAYFGSAGDLDAFRATDVPDVGMRRVAGSFLAVRGHVLDAGDVVQFSSVGDVATACTFDVNTTTVRTRIQSVSPNWGTATPTVGAGTDADGEGSTDGDGSSDGDGTRSATAESTVSRIDVPDGYEGYETEVGAYWLGGDHLLYAPDRRLVRAMYDAHVGVVDRYAANADVEAVLDAAGERDLLAFAARSNRAVSDASAFGYAWGVDETVTLTAPFAFPEAEATDQDAVAQLTDMAGFTDYEDFDVATSGRVVTLTGDLPTSEFDLLQRDGDGSTRTASASRPPQVSFAFDANPGEDGEWDGGEDERVVVTHQGGDSVTVANVALHYEGTNVADLDAFTSTKPNDDGRWVAGGEWILRATADGTVFESGATLEVVWTSDDGSRSAVIAMFQLP